MTLDMLNMGESAVILKVKGRGAFRKRIMEMGFVTGKEVTAVKVAPLLDPVEFSIMGYNLSLRRSEAKMIDIAACGEDVKTCSYEGVLESESMKTGTRPVDKTISIALVGNPNCGKTTIFNNISGSQERVGNYSGVTVEAKEASIDYKGYSITVTDLPGTYSITAYTPEELYVRSFILDNVPDIVVNVVDSSNLERNLYLTTQLIDMDIKVVVALNMFDEIQKRGDRFDYEELSAMLGIPMIPTVGSKGKGLIELLDRIIEVYEDRDPLVRHIHINYGADIEKSIHEIQKVIRSEKNCFLTDLVSSRFLAIKLLEKDRDSRERIEQCDNAHEVFRAAEQQIRQLETAYREDSETVITDAKYGFIAGALRETFTAARQFKRRATETIDAFLTNKLFGFPFFFAMMWLMFQGTFTLGQFPVDAIDTGVKALSSLIEAHMPASVLKDLVIEGIIGGVGGVIIYLPNILILFFFISLMEDTGYMARAAFIMDKVMHRIGLHGKSFIPLVMGFGCNVPAVMATRTIESRTSRMITMLITPLMSCSARLPLYILLTGAFFSKNASVVMLLLYVTGIFLAVVMARLFRRFLFNKEDTPFVMELPPYRMPTGKSILLHMWEKAKQYLKKMGGVILVASIIIWFLGYFPRTTVNSSRFEQEIAQVEQSNLDASAKSSQVGHLKQLMTIDHQQHSFIGQIGQAIQPVVSPLGFNWKISVSLLSGMAAKEVVVSTLSVLYTGNSDDSEVLSQRLTEDTNGNGTPDFTPIVALSLMFFVLIYFPCIATITAIVKESGSWKWGALVIGYTCVLAWIVAFIVFQTGSLLVDLLK